MPIFDKNKSDNQKKNSSFTPQTVEHQDRLYEVINGNVVRERIEHQGDGFVLRSNSATLHMTQPGTGYDIAVTGSASGYIINDLFTRSNSNTSLGSPNTGISSVAWKNKKGIFGISSNKARLIKQSILSSTASTDYDTDYTGSRYNIALYNAGVSLNFEEQVQTSVTVASASTTGGLVFRSNSDATDFFALKPVTVFGTYALVRIENFYTETILFNLGLVPSSSDTLKVVAIGNSFSGYVNGLYGGMATQSFTGSSLTSVNTHFGIITNQLSTNETYSPTHEWDDFYLSIPGEPTGSVSSLVNFPSGIRYEAPIFPDGCEEAYGVLNDYISSYIHGSEEEGMEVRNAYMELKQAGFLAIYGGRFYFTTKTCAAIGDSYLEISENGLFLYKDGVLRFGLDAHTGDVYYPGIEVGEGSGGSAGAKGDTGDSGVSGVSGQGGSGISGNSSSGISGQGGSGISGNAQSGISGNAQSGISGNSSSGISGNSSSGISGNSSSGISGNAAQQSGTSGISGNSSSGISGNASSGISGAGGSGISGDSNGASGISGNAQSGISGNATSGTSGISGNASSGISGQLGLTTFTLNALYGFPSTTFIANGQNLEFSATLIAIRASLSGTTGSTINVRKNGITKHLEFDFPVSASDVWLSASALSAGTTSYVPNDKLEFMFTSIVGSPNQISIQAVFTQP